MRHWIITMPQLLFTACISDIKTAGVALDEPTEGEADVTQKARQPDEEQMMTKFESLGYPVKEEFPKRYKAYRDKDVIHEKADMVFAMSTVEGILIQC